MAGGQGWGGGRGVQRRSPLELEAYVELLTHYFFDLLQAGRGDSARARSLHTLYFFEFIWSRPHLPLFSYRPSRRPVAFLAMVFDLIGDVSGEYTQQLWSGGEAFVRADLARRLASPWRTLMAQLGQNDLPRLAAVLDETLRAALRQPGQSDLGSYLAKLQLYMTPEQLRQVDVALLLDSLSVAEVFDYLRFNPPHLRRTGEEQHPASGDLRQAIRASYDLLWAETLTQLTPSTVTLLAALPVDALSLLHAAPPEDEDFAVFYARTTDAREPGRIWQPPAHLVAAEDWGHFTFLTGRGSRDSLSRRSQGLSRLGLSRTFPATIARFDAWLERAPDFPELHARRPWQEGVAAQADLIAQTRAHFLELLARQLTSQGSSP